MRKYLRECVRKCYHVKVALYASLKVTMKQLIVVDESIVLMSQVKGAAVTRVVRQVELTVGPRPGMSKDEMKTADESGVVITRASSSTCT